MVSVKNKIQSMIVSREPKDTANNIKLPTPPVMLQQMDEFDSRDRVSVHFELKSNIRKTPDIDGSIKIHRVPHSRIQLDDIEPGDLLFFYKWGDKHTMHHLIGFVQALHKYAQRSHRRYAGSSQVTHSCIVVEVDKDKRRLKIAEASGSKGKICITELNFADPTSKHSNVDMGTCYLFYRLKSKQVSKNMANIGQRWAKPEGQTYPLRRAKMAWMRLPHVLFFGRDRLGKVLEHAHSGDVGAPYPMFCSELVTAVGAAASVEAALVGLSSDYSDGIDLRGLPQKELFYRELGATLPVHLHGAMLRSNEVQTVGYVLPGELSASDA